MGPVTEDTASTAIRFPEGFAWGSATAAYQIEGAATEDGRGPSIWDTFAHTPGKVENGDTGDVADDHYHRFREDVDIMADIGLTHYRFSLSWPRVQPGGTGPLNPAGLAFYDRLLDALHEKGIVPWVTLYHWDLPQELEDLGGWPERDTASRFADYAAAMHEHFGDRIRHWTTLNEPWCSAFVGYAEGRHAPGRTSGADAMMAAHHLMLGHGLAVQAMRAGSRHTEGHSYGVTLNLYPVDPASEDPADIDAARRIDGLHNRLFLDPILRGSYPADVLEDVAEVTDASFVLDGDLSTTSTPVDWVGVNYYFRHVVRAGTGPRVTDRASHWVGSHDVEKTFLGLPRTAMGWEIDDQGLHDTLLRVHREYDAPAMYITENGAAFDDVVSEDGRVHDTERVDYLDRHFRTAHRLLEDGVDLRGYFVWSLLDNFEWARGYGKRFGLVHVDYDTLQRTPKDSARWYADVIRRGGLPA